jgi:hypothetical protein
MRPQTQPCASDSLRHRPQVALESIEVEDQRRGLDGINRITGAGC